MSLWPDDIKCYKKELTLRPEGRTKTPQQQQLSAPIDSRWSVKTHILSFPKVVMKY